MKHIYTNYPDGVVGYRREPEPGDVVDGDLLQQDTERFEKDAEGYREAAELIRQDEPEDA